MRKKCLKDIVLDLTYVECYYRTNDKLTTSAPEGPFKKR